MKEIRKEIMRQVMVYAWKLARKQAEIDNCSARECFAWALKKAWESLKECDACFDAVQLLQAYDVADIYNDDVLVPLPAVMALLGYMKYRFVLVWSAFNAYFDSSHEVRAFHTTGQRFLNINSARNEMSCINTQFGLSNAEMPFIAYALTGLDWGC